MPRLQQFQMITLDVNELPMDTLVQLQKLVIQELVNREKIIGDHLLKSHEQEVLEKQEIERLKKAQDVLIMEKAQLLDDRLQLEKYVSFTCQEILDIIDEMVVEEKYLWLGQFITDLRGYLKELQEQMTPRTPPEQVVECKTKIEEVYAQLEESEKDTKAITYYTAQFLGSVVQDEQLQQLSMQLQEAEA